MNDFTSEACKDFARMLESEEGYDVKIYVDEEPNMEEIHAHSFVLRARCPYFKTAFSSNWAKKEDGYYIFYKPNVTASVFRIVLRHWYSGDVDWTNYTEDDIFQLLIITDEFGLRSLNEHVEIHLIKNHLKYLEENPIKILQVVDSHNSFASLKKLCLKKLCSNAKEFFNLDVFLTIEEPILLMILKCEDLNNIKEIEIWDSVLKWGLARFPEIDNDVKKWAPQDFINMRDTLKNIIPLIRFREISGKDYFDKIKPYKKIIEKDFRDNILRYYIVNDEKSLSNLPFRCPVINSTLIDQKHVLLFSSWIDKAGKLYDSVEQVKYKFMLLYQSNKEGLEVSRYHQRCDAVSKTLTVVGIQNSDQIIGGYNPLDWSGYGYKSTFGSFIFNLNNKNDINTAKFSYVKDSSFAVYCDTLYLPTFGAGHDIFLSENSSSGSSSYSYNNIYIPKSFNIGTIEVFQVIEKK